MIARHLYHSSNNLTIRINQVTLTYRPILYHRIAALEIKRANSLTAFFQSLRMRARRLGARVTPAAKKGSLKSSYLLSLIRADTVAGGV